MTTPSSGITAANPYSIYGPTKTRAPTNLDIGARLRRGGDFVLFPRILERVFSFIGKAYGQIPDIISECGNGRA
jgi:hypothetical protein